MNGEQDSFGMSGQSTERISLRVTGRVQGVGFRNFTHREARRLGVKGWVRNETDGSVRVEAEGPRKELEKLHESLQQGPRTARVEDVSASWKEPTDEFDGFSVRY